LVERQRRKAKGKYVRWEENREEEISEVLYSEVVVSKGYRQGYYF
jgi:hypothetical protein